MNFLGPSSALALAFAMDLALGDPAWRLHPVRLMGAGVRAWEKALRASRLPLRQAGLVLALGLPASVFALALAMRSLAWRLDSRAGAGGYLAWAVEGAMLWSTFSVRDMLAHARQVLEALMAGDLELAKQKVGRMVGRDVQGLDPQGVARACVESVAEGACDALAAPLFWAAVGGAPLALAYRCVNTLDSMVGHKDERYREFGMASALLDDLVNWIPARLAALLAVAAAWLLEPGPGGRGQAAWRAWVTALEAGPLGTSPNAGWSEGAFAGALGVQLGGPLSYGGETAQAPTFGRPIKALGAGSILAACRLYLGTALLALLLACAAASLRAEGQPEPLTLSAADGTRLALDWTHGPKLKRQVLLLSPGFGQHRRTKPMSGLARALSPTVDVLSLDYRGTGGSAGRYNFGADEYADLLAACHWARQRYARVSVLGFSLGSYNAARALLEEPGAADQLLLVSCPPRVEAIVSSGGFLAEPWSYLFDRSKWGLGNDPDFFFRWGSVFERKPDLVKEAHRLSLPVHFLVGGHDRLVFERLTRRIHDRVSGLKTWRKLEGVGHAESGFLSHPREFVEWVVECLAFKGAAHGA